MTKNCRAATRVQLVKLSVLTIGFFAVQTLWAANLTVSSSGAPEISYPLAVPPGVAGMAPALTLEFSGDARNGPFGYGWSLNGLSKITRCPATIATDGIRSGITFTSDDKLCLDGQRLIAIDASGEPRVGSGTRDAAGVAPGSYREFRTEIDAYARIRAYGYANNDYDGWSGPAYFKVWTKTGAVYEYGDAPSRDSNTNALISRQTGTVAMAWAVARVSDFAGNHVDFKYEQRSVAWGSSQQIPPHYAREWNIKEIQYSGNKVVFAYDPLDGRSDKSEAYAMGQKNVNVRRIDSISTYINSPNTSSLGPAANAVAVRTYKLAFDTGPVTARSRLTSIQECAGSASSTRCLPRTSFTYSDGGTDVYVASPAFNLPSFPMVSRPRNFGLLVGDFNGDGRTDFIRWHDSAANNQLWTSQGNGSFSQANNFNITTENLMKSDACYIAYVLDVNGDGLPDIVRYSSSINQTGAACATSGPTLVYISNGDGSFASSTYSGPVLKQDSTANFFFLDFTGDGRSDLITTIPGTTSMACGPAGSDRCAVCTDPSGVCTRVYRGVGNGSFQEIATNIGQFPVYSKPTNLDVNAPPRVYDVDADGLQDLGGWRDASGTQVFGMRSRGDGNFDPYETLLLGVCRAPIDFNGDGQSDCLWQKTATPNIDNSLEIGGGAYMGYQQFASAFNLNGSNQLFGQGVGFSVADVNRDGRQDIIRWSDNASQNVLYLSNGDGSFRTSPTFNLGGAPLKDSENQTDFIVGDFTGRGNAELLRMRTTPESGSQNILYLKQDHAPPDQLMSVIGPSGARTDVVHVSLTSPMVSATDPIGPRYVSDRGTANAAVSPNVDVIYPKYVVATVRRDSGVAPVSQNVLTEYRYTGLKMDTSGRGSTGFREVRRQDSGADGSPLTAVTQRLQTYPYTGMASSISSFASALGATTEASRLTQTSVVYCDQTAAAGSDTVAIATGVSCATTAKIRRPYQLWSATTARDLTGTALPTTTTQTSVNATGDPLRLVVTKSGRAAGLDQTFVQTTDNEFFPDNTSCSSDGVTCRWILGRIRQQTVTNSVPNSLASIATSAGTSPYATATNGASTFPNPPARPVDPAALAAVLQLLLDD